MRIELAHQVDQFAYLGTLQQRSSLEHRADATRLDRSLWIDAEDLGVPLSWVDQTEHDGDRGRFAGTVRTEQCHSLAGLDLKIDSVERSNLIERHADVLEAHGCFSDIGASSRLSLDTTVDDG